MRPCSLIPVHLHNRLSASGLWSTTLLQLQTLADISDHVCLLGDTKAVALPFRQWSCKKLIGLLNAYKYAGLKHLEAIIHGIKPCPPFRDEKCGFLIINFGEGQ